MLRKEREEFLKPTKVVSHLCTNANSVREWERAARTFVTQGHRGQHHKSDSVTRRPCWRELEKHAWCLIGVVIARDAAIGTERQSRMTWAALVVPHDLRRGDVDNLFRGALHDTQARREGMPSPFPNRVHPAITAHKCAISTCTQRHMMKYHSTTPSLDFSN